MILPYEVWYQLICLNSPVAAEIAILNSARRGWVGVYPIVNNDNIEFAVRRFEVEKYIIENDYDIATPQLLNNVLVTASNEEELEKMLERWLTSLEELVLPYLCDYPL